LKYFGIVLLLLWFYGGVWRSTEICFTLWISHNREKSGFYKILFYLGKREKVFSWPSHGGRIETTRVQESSVEADINLNVALALRDLLVLAGGEVLLSRNKDTTVELKDRSLLANKSGANIFISIHHNAQGKKEDIGLIILLLIIMPMKMIMNMNHVREILRGIYNVIYHIQWGIQGNFFFWRQLIPITIFIPGRIFSFKIDKNSAVLVECGFTTSEYESDLITIKEFNNVEAWGIFRDCADTSKTESLK